ncbi:MAG: glutathione S-transferase family protein, partial [Leptolyngbya sp. SIO1D8]|nr:glutathione S-transferase family protein [Leptolyngbya sp. SIO1D8]
YLDTIRQDYYGNLFPLNPGGIISLGPDPTEWHQSHLRESVAKQPSQSALG